jgi:hypothetical protein
MKKTLSFLCVAVLLVSTAYPKSKTRLPPKELETEVKQVVLVTDLSSQMTKDLFAGLHPHIAIECKEGTELPFKYKGDFGLFSVNFAPNLSIKLEKTVYLRFVNVRPDRPEWPKVRGFISFDLKHWEKASKFNKIRNPEFDFGISPDKTHVLLESKIAPPVE